MFVNTLSQKTIEALDSDARALLRKPVTAARHVVQLLRALTAGTPRRFRG